MRTPEPGGRPSRLLFVTSEFPPGPGGIGTHAHQLALQLSRLGWNVEVVACQDYASDAEIESFGRAQPFPIARMRRFGPAPIEAIYRHAVLNRAVRRHAPDVLVASGSRSVMLAAARHGAAALPWVAIGHGGEFGVRGRWWKAATRRAFERANAVVCVSEYTVSQMAAAGIRPARVRVIPNGGDPERFRVLPGEDAASVRRQLGLPATARVIVTVGNVSLRKGQDIVVRALPEIRKRAGDVHYVLAGLPTIGDRIRELAREQDVADRVHVLGRVGDADVVRWLNAADLFVMTSRHTGDGDFEGYGIAVVEAALCGTPAVVASGSGLAEAIEHRVTGLCVAEEDPGATAEAIASLLRDDAERLRMGQAARDRAERDQTWESRARAYDGELRDLTGANRAESQARPRYPAEARR